MSRNFPHTAYAEDQPLAKTILTTHVLTRGVTAGTIVGTGIFGVRDLVHLLPSRRRKEATTTSSRPPSPGRTHIFLRTAGRSTLWTLGLVSVGLVGRMWGREEIEWKDRSWRLLENKGQVETDDWTYGGMLVGLAASAVVKAPGLIGIAGSVGTGSVFGRLGYMGWRYGVNKGKFPED